MKRSLPPASALAPTALADLTAAITPIVLHAVLKDHRRLAPSMAGALSNRKTTTAKERHAIARTLGALLRWWGWIEPLRSQSPREQLLLAWLLDSTDLSPMARLWASQLGRHPERLTPVGDAPSWTVRAGGLKRWMAGRPVNADPWRLFPAWLRDQLPVPPGDATPKERRLSFLAALQAAPPLWVGLRDRSEKDVWAELRDAGLKPWIHRRVKDAAKLPPETDLSRLPAFRSGRLVAQDLASQAVGIVCDPDGGERWCDLCGDNGLHALHLAALMGGKGVVVSTFEQERRRHDAALRLRKGAYHNIATRLWDGRHPPGKPASYDGMLVDVLCSGVGSWRRHPDARWVIAPQDILGFASRQAQILDTASKGVRPGGSLIYTVPTVTRSETVDVVSAFLSTHSEFTLDPFPHPLENTTTGGTVQLWSHLIDGDSRFIARMIRSAAPKPADSRT
jgi:16S rRNA (cytosine967-C5)-methyltransferase